MEIFELTKKQQAAFYDLVYAVERCKKLNIGFFTVLEETFAFNGNLIKSFGVDEHNEVDCAKYGYPSNTLTLGGCSYADDQNMHSFKLTEKGRKSFLRDRD